MKVSLSTLLFEATILLLLCIVMATEIDHVDKLDISLFWDNELGEARDRRSLRTSLAEKQRRKGRLRFRGESDNVDSPVSTGEFQENTMGNEEFPKSEGVVIKKGSGGLDPSLTGFTPTTAVPVNGAEGRIGTGSQIAAVERGGDSAVSPSVALAPAPAPAASDAVDPFGDGNPPDPPSAVPDQTQSLSTTLPDSTYGSILHDDRKGTGLLNEPATLRKDTSEGEFSGFDELEKEEVKGIARA